MIISDMEPESYDGGIDSLIDREFIAKLFDLTELNERELIAIDSCVMGSVTKTDLAKQLNVSIKTAHQIINNSIKKLRYSFIKNQKQLAGQAPPAPVDLLIKAEQIRYDKENAKLDVHGTVHWYKGDVLHREGAPAVIQRNGGQAWFFYGVRHREGGPAIEYADGSKEWWVHGKRHRLDGYAVEHADGKRQKWIDGKIIYE